MKERVSCDSDALADALKHPLELPPPGRCVVPGDSVTVVADPRTPNVQSIIVAVCDQLIGAGIELDITVLLPADESGNQHRALTDAIVTAANTVTVQIHDPDDEQQRRYLASSSAGERIYLSEHLIDADLIVNIGMIGFDPQLRHSGTNSLFYPTFSGAETIRRFREAECAEHHAQAKPLTRETVDEIGWLLGSQFAVQIIPSSDGDIGIAFCGTADHVLAHGIRWLDEHWTFDAESVSDLVVVSVAASAGDEWKQVGTALAAALQVVEQGGRIVVISDVPTAAGPGLRLLHGCADPEDLINPLRLEPTVDAVEVLQLLAAMRHADVYLRSSLESDFVEELGLIPLATDSEIQRLLDRSVNPLVVHGANFARLTSASAVQVDE